MTRDRWSVLAQRFALGPPRTTPGADPAAAAQAARLPGILHAMAGQALDDPDPAHRRFAGRQLAGLLGGGLAALRRDIGLACAALAG